MRGRSVGARFTGDDRRELRALIRRGETFESAARTIGCSTKLIQRLLNQHGGCRDRSRPRCPLRLSEKEREEISRGLKSGLSCRAIANKIGRAPSTVTRDVRLGGGRNDYRAVIAENCAHKLRRRPKQLKLLKDASLRQVKLPGLSRHIEKGG